ncbi:oligoendopeptidase F [Priestia megaterium]|nr:oligoendopeptidase F [Priestia megaterium]
MNREKVEEIYKWDLTALYPNEVDWENEFLEVQEKLPSFQPFEGNLNDATTLYNCLFLDEALSLKVERLYVYASLKRDEDTRNNNSQRFVEKVSSLSARYYETTSFIIPEILNIQESELENFYLKEQRLIHYKKQLTTLFRDKVHVLSDTEERLLASISETRGTASDIFSALENADMVFPSIELPSGEKVELTQSNYYVYIKHNDRSVREHAYKALYHTYMNYRNTISKTLSSHIKENVVYSSLRKYPSALEKSLFHDDIPKEVYTQLISTTKKHLPTLVNYMNIRKKLLGLSQLEMWDLSVPLLNDYNKIINYEEAYNDVLEGLQVLGTDYVELLKRAKKERWIDVYENAGKRGGAYAWGAYGTHPYVLLNHKDDIGSLFTLAHELGHALHSYYSDESQSYTYAQYVIFVAEVASTVNEVLVMEYLLEKAKASQDLELEKYLLNYFLEQFKSTVFRQVMFAEFELLTHEQAEKGEPLTADDFKDIYGALHKEYHGGAVIQGEEITYEWMRIPHFYTPFYVYKYATGFSAAIAIAKAIREEGAPAVTRYKEFLRSGGTDFPIELLKKAGVDMSSSKPVDEALSYFSTLVERFQQLTSAN